MPQNRSQIELAERTLIAGDRDGAVAVLEALLADAQTDDVLGAIAQIALLADAPELAQTALTRRAGTPGEASHGPDDALQEGSRRTSSAGPDDRPTLELHEPRARADEDAEHLDPDLGPDERLAHLLDPAHADVVRFIHLFAGREDRWARQWVDGERTGYSPVTGPVTPDLVRAHLAGSVTIGVYPLRSDQTVTFFAFDLDIRRAARDAAQGNLAAIQTLRGLVRDAAQRLRDGLVALGLPVLVEQSGFKGWHVWGFLAASLPADLVHRFGRLATAQLRPVAADITVEFFPRQPQVASDGLGNLIKLPLGIHRRTGRRALFVDQAFGGFDDPFTPLRTVERITRDQLLDAIDALQAKGPPPPDPEPDPRVAPHTPAAAPRRGALRRLPPSELPHHPTLGHVVRGCNVVRALVETAVATRRMSHDERVVLAQSLGGLDDGVAAVNGLFAMCPEVAPHELLQRPLRGHPISCAGVRRRVPHVTRCVDCHCLFEPDNLAYPSPVLHAPPASRLPAPAVATSPGEVAQEWPDDAANAAGELWPDAPPSVANEGSDAPASGQGDEYSAEHDVTHSHASRQPPSDEAAQRAAGAENYPPVEHAGRPFTPANTMPSAASPVPPPDPPPPDRAPVVHLPAPDLRGPDAALVDGLAEALLRLPEQRISVAGGTFKLRLVGGRHVVVFTPKGG